MEPVVTISLTAAGLSVLLFTVWAIIRRARSKE